MNREQQFCFDDFTLSHYRELLSIMKDRYDISLYSKDNLKVQALFLRHDIDFSPIAAKRIAELEYQAGIKSTYFLYLHSQFYNLLDSNTISCINAILEMGHHIGLHFDVAPYGISSEDQLESNLLFEKDILQNTFKSVINVFSFHNTNEFTMSFRKWQYAKMINVYSDFFQKHVGYCSDSNGYWRFKRLKDFLLNPEVSILQVLVHPVWWVETPCSPRQRILRYISDKAEHQEIFYDKFLLQSGRLNVN